MMDCIDKFEKRIAILYIIIAILIGIIAIILKIELRKIDQLEKEKGEMQQKLIECKWELDQIPYIDWGIEE